MPTLRNGNIEGCVEFSKHGVSTRLHGIALHHNFIVVTKQKLKESRDKLICETKKRRYPTIKDNGFCLLTYLFSRV